MNFFVKALIKKQLKNVPEDQIDMLIAVIEKNPDFFLTKKPTFVFRLGWFVRIVGDIDHLVGTTARSPCVQITLRRFFRILL